MHYPKAGEKKSDYIARFVSDSEAKSDFPDEKQRLAVAYSMFGEKKNAGPFGSAEHPWPKAFQCNFIEPGLVFYQDLGLCKVCGDKQSCGEGQCQTDGEMVLVGQEALAKMAKSYVGRPVIDVVHKDVEPETVAEGDADGIVTRVWLDGESGWWKAEFLVWNPETQKHCESPEAWSVSCAYEPSEVDSAGGEYHNIPYHQEIKDGVYTHLAIVTSPRYEGARITLANSKSFVKAKPKGGKEMSWNWLKRGERKNASPVDLAEKVNVGGEDVSMGQLFDALPEEKKEEAPKYNDDMMLSGPKGEKSFGELKKNWLDLKEKKNAEGKDIKTSAPADKGAGNHEESKSGAFEAPKGGCAHCGHPAFNEKEEAPGETKPLPDLRDKENDASEDAAKKLDKEAKEKEALKLEQAKADDEAKAAEEKKNADDKAAAEAKAKEEKRNAGKKAFSDLRNARGEFSADDAKIMPVSVDDRLARGRAKYGSAA